MKTRELLEADETLLVAQLKTMKLKELERHAAKLLGRAGQHDYPAVLRKIIEVVPSLSGGDRDPFSAMQAVVRNQLPLASNEDSLDDRLVQRIAVLMMVIVKSKFEKIHQR